MLKDISFLGRTSLSLGESAKFLKSHLRFFLTALGLLFAHFRKAHKKPSETLDLLTTNRVKLAKANLRLNILIAS